MLKLSFFFAAFSFLILYSESLPTPRIERNSGAKKKENLFISADANGDSRVDMLELNKYVLYGPQFWKAVWAAEDHRDAIKKYQAFFTKEKLAALDLNRDGTVDDGELRKYSLDYIKEWMDIDHDGFISKWEFEMNMNILMGDSEMTG